MLCNFLSLSSSEVMAHSGHLQTWLHRAARPAAVQSLALCGCHVCPEPLH